MKGLEAKEDETYEDMKLGLIDEAGYRRQIEKIREGRHHFTDLLEQAQLALSDEVLKTCDRLLELLINSESLLKPQNRPQLVKHLRFLMLEPLLGKGPQGARVQYDLEKPVASIVALKGSKVDSELWWASADQLRTNLVNYSWSNVAFQFERYLESGSGGAFTVGYFG